MSKKSHRWLEYEILVYRFTMKSAVSKRLQKGEKGKEAKMKTMEKNVDAALVSLLDII